MSFGRGSKKAYDVDPAYGSAAEAEDVYEEPPTYGGLICDVGFSDFDDALEHIDLEHPGVSLHEALVDLDESPDVRTTGPLGGALRVVTYSTTTTRP